MNDEEIVELIIGFDSLYQSMIRCKRNVSWKNSVARYYLHGIEETLKLEAQLKGGTYKAKPPKEIKITHPKPRTAVSIGFKDRVYQRSLNDNVLYPYMTKQFIHQNFACQKGKGTDLARATLDKYLHRAYMHYGLDFHVLQCDIHDYYPNMNHEVAEKTFHDKLPPIAYEMTETILRDQYGGNVGYNPGSQMIQIAGISVLSPMDHFIKERLHIKLYIRYMDDFVLIHPDRGYLEYCRQQVTAFLKKMGFELNPTKTRIYPARAGVKMLGFTHRLTPTGRVVRIISSENVRSERRKLRRMVNLAKKGLMTRTKVYESYQGWKAHAGKGDTHGLQVRMDKYYHTLWSE